MKTIEKTNLWTRFCDLLTARCVVRHYYPNIWDMPSPKKIRGGALRRLRRLRRSERWGTYFSHLKIHRAQERRLEPELCRLRREEIKADWVKRRAETP